MGTFTASMIKLYVCVLMLIPWKMSPYWEANTPLDRPEIPLVLCNTMFHFRVHKSLPLYATLSYTNPVHSAIVHYFKNFLTLYFRLQLSLPYCLLLSNTSITVLNVHFLRHGATCPTFSCFLICNALIIFGEEYKIMKILILHLLFHPLFFFTSLRSRHSLIPLISNALNLCFFYGERPSSTSVKKNS